MNNKIKYMLVVTLMATMLTANDEFASAKVNIENVKHYISNSYTSEDIKKLNTKDFYSFLNEQTSIVIATDAGPLRQKIDLRGYGITDGYQNIVININGQRMNNIDTVPQLLSSISIDNIESIEIIKGSGSVKHGDGATAGVINIKTKNKTTSYIKSYIGNNNTKYNIINVGFLDENIILNIMTDYYSTDGLKSDDAWSKNKKVNMQYFLNDDIEVRMTRSLTDIYSKYAKPIRDINIYNTDPSNIDEGFNTEKSKANYTMLGGSYNIATDTTLDIDYTNEDKEITTFSTNKYNEQKIKAKLNLSVNDIKIETGITINNGDRKGSSDITSKVNEGIYLASTYVKNNIKFSSGLRYEEVEYKYNPNSGSILIDKEYLNAYDLGINMVIDDYQSVFTNYNKAFLTPAIDRFFNWNGTFNGFLKPTISKTTNIGYKNKTKMNTFDFTLFRTNLTNEMFLNKFVGSGWGENRNIDKSHKYGLELFNKYKINENYYASVNYSYIIAKVDHESTSGGLYDNKYLPGVSKHNVVLNLGFNMNKYSGVLTHTYRSEAYAMEDFSNSFTQKIEAYNSTNLSMNYEYNQELEIFAKIENIFNKTNGLWLRDDVIYPMNFETTYYAGMKVKF